MKHVKAMSIVRNLGGASALCLIGLACAGLSASADVVTNDYFSDVTSPTTLRGVTNVIAKCRDVNVSADLTLDDRTFLWLRGESENSRAYVNLAPTAGDVTLTVQGNSGFFTAYRYSMDGSNANSEWGRTGVEPASMGKNTAPSYYYVRMGVAGGEPGSTGRARIVLNTNPEFGYNAYSGFWARQLDIETSVSPDPVSGMIDFLEISEGALADIARIQVKATAHPARVLFKGGALFRNNSTSNGSPLWPVSGATLVLQGVGGEDVYLRAQFAEFDFTGRKGGAVRVVGKDVCLFYAGNVPDGVNGTNFKQWRLDSSDNVTWENTGDLCLAGNAWLKTTSDDLLPHGPSTGGLSLGCNTGVSAADAAAGKRVPYCCLDLYGTRQRLNGVTSTGSGTWQGVVTNTHATATGTLVLGDGDVSGTLNAKCAERVAVEKAGSGLLTVRSTTGESLDVQAGLAVFAGANAFTNVTAAAGATLSGDVTVTGAFTAPGETPPSAHGLGLSLAAGATVSVSGGTPLALRSLTVGGTAVAKGVYTADAADWLSQGSVTVLSTAGETVAVTDVAWTGAGETTAASDAGNWAAAADFSALGSRPVFATGGTAAQLDGLYVFSGLRFSAADGFALAAGPAGSALLFGDIDLAAVDGARRTYEVAAPLALVADQTVTMPTNVTLRLTGGLTGQYGLEMVGTKLGEGEYDYDDAGGELVLENARISGEISHARGGGWLVLRGDVGCPGDTSSLSLNYARPRDGSDYRASGTLLAGLTRLEGATVRKPVKISGIGQVVGEAASWLIGAAGTVNTFMETVACGPSTTFRAEQDATIVFRKGVSVTGGSLGLFSADGATGARYELDGPARLESRNRTFQFRGSPEVVFRSRGNYSRHFVEMSAVAMSFGVDDAFTDTGFHFTSDEAVVDLGTTHQTMGWLSSGLDPYPYFTATNDVANPTRRGLKGTVRGDWPATLEVTAGVVDGAQSVTNCGVQFTGWVALAKSGEGVHRMLRRDYESYGDVEVSGGRLEFDAGATWRNGTNVTVRGTGTLKVGSGRTFRDDVRVTAEGDGWTMDLTGMQKAASFVVDGEAMPAGAYGPGHATLGAHFTGTGVLRVGRVGSRLVLR